jgi:hypothetical protein
MGRVFEHNHAIVYIKSNLPSQTKVGYDNGTYLMVHPAGTFTVIAEACGYTPVSYSEVVISESGTTTRDFELVSLEDGDDLGGGSEDSEDEGGEDASQDGGGQDDGEGEGIEGGGDSDGSYFIATAAYGSPMEPFRERFMLANTAGKAFVHFYYTYSPPVADFIARHDTVRLMVRWSLLPLLGVSWMALHLGPGVAPALMGFLICLMRASAGLTHRRLRPRHQA